MNSFEFNFHSFKSCGFCPPLEKEIIDNVVEEVTFPSTIGYLNRFLMSVLFVLYSVVVVQTTTTRPSSTTTTVPSTTTIKQLCRDLHFKCVTWKKMGFCTSLMYKNYMEKNCPRSCGVCSVFLHWYWSWGILCHNNKGVLTDPVVGRFL